MMKSKYFTIAPDTSPDDLKRQYRQLCQKYHPDKPGGDKDTIVQIMDDYKKALEILADRAKQENKPDEYNAITQEIERHLVSLYLKIKDPLIKQIIPAKYQDWVSRIIRMFDTDIQ